MELTKELALYLENTPEFFGQKLVIVKACMELQPALASVAEDMFYDWTLAGMESLMNEVDLDPDEIEVAVCRELARTVAKEELQKIKAGAYKELDIEIREALEAGLRPGTRVQVRQDGKEASGKTGIIMEDDLSEMLPTEFLTSEDEVAVRLHDDQVISVPINRLDVVEAATMFAKDADLLVAAEAVEAAPTRVPNPQPVKTGLIEKVQFTRGGYGEQSIKIDGVQYATWFSANDPKMKGIGPGAKVKYIASKDDKTPMGNGQYGPIYLNMPMAEILEVVQPSVTPLFD